MHGPRVRRVCDTCIRGNARCLHTRRTPQRIEEGAEGRERHKERATRERERSYRLAGVQRLLHFLGHANPIRHALRARRQRARAQGCIPRSCATRVAFVTAMRAPGPETGALPCSHRCTPMAKARTERQQRWCGQGNDHSMHAQPHRIRFAVSPGCAGCLRKDFVPGARGASAADHAGPMRSSRLRMALVALGL